MTITAARPISSHTAPRASMPERRGESAQTVERIDRHRPGASPPPCVTGAAAGFLCTWAHCEYRCVHRADRGQPVAAGRDRNVHALLLRAYQLENPLFDGGRKFLRKAASRNLFHAARVRSAVDTQPRPGRRDPPDVFRIEAAAGLSSL